MHSNFQDLTAQVSALELRLAQLDGEHRAELERARLDRERTAEAAESSAREALRLQREQLSAEARLTAERLELCSRKMRAQLQESSRAKEAEWVRVRADYEARIAQLEEEIDTTRFARCVISHSKSCVEN